MAVLGLGTGSDHFTVAQLKRELAAVVNAQRLPDRLGNRDLPLRR